MLYLFLLAHLVADFMLQPYRLVVRKRYWDGLAIHGGIVLACMLALIPLDSRIGALWPAMLAITAVHVLADYWKVHHADSLLRPAIVPFLLDQAIHYTTIAAALSLVLPPAEVWIPASVPLALPAILLAGYVVAAFATPIGVMIWLDPGFRHVAIAGRARLRSLVAAAAVVSLAVLGGVAALPVTLAGYALAARRPASPHPLDAPTGLVVVLVIASTLGVFLRLVLGAGQ